MRHSSRVDVINEEKEELAAEDNSMSQQDRSDKSEAESPGMQQHTMMGGNANNSQMQLGSGGHGRQPGAIGSLSSNFNIKDDKNAGAGNSNASSSGTGKKKGG